MILELLHFGLGVPGFPWTGQVAEAEAGGQGGRVAGAGGPGRLRPRTCATFQKTAKDASLPPVHLTEQPRGGGGNVGLLRVVEVNVLHGIYKRPAELRMTAQASSATQRCCSCVNALTRGANTDPPRKCKLTVMNAERLRAELETSRTAVGADAALLCSRKHHNKRIACRLTCIFCNFSVKYRK